MWRKNDGTGILPFLQTPEKMCIRTLTFWKDSQTSVSPAGSTRSVQKVSSHVLWKIETFMEEDTRNIVYRTMTPLWVPFKGGTLGPHTVLPVAISCPVVFSWISSMVWNLFPFKGGFSFGKSQKSQGAKSGLREGSRWVFLPHMDVSLSLLLLPPFLPPSLKSINISPGEDWKTESGDLHLFLL